LKIKLNCWRSNPQFSTDDFEWRIVVALTFQIKILELTTQPNTPGINVEVMRATGNTIQNKMGYA
jgi:hypothetical protein